MQLTTKIDNSLIQNWWAEGCYEESLILSLFSDLLASAEEIIFRSWKLPWQFNYEID